MRRDPLSPRRNPVPPAPDVPGEHISLSQPSLFWRAWDLEQDRVTLARIARSGFRRFRVHTTWGTEQARFQRGTLTLGELHARPAAGGAVVGSARLSYRTHEIEYPTLADHDGVLALVGDARGSGFSATAKVWVADRLLREGPAGVRTLAATVLILKERPGTFRPPRP